MNKLSFSFWILFSCFALLSCSTFNKMAVGTSSHLLYSMGEEAQSGSNFELFKSGAAANLMLLEGLLSASPNNLNILATLTKGYAGYAFAVNETQMMEEEWAELKSEEGKRQALFNYTRAMNFGLRYLKEKNIELSEILTHMNEPQGIHFLLDKKFSTDKRDLEVVLFTAQAYGGLINLQKDNMVIVSELSAVKGLFDWVCQKDPSINYGTCDIFYGAYEAGRPQMLGGNPAKGKEIFLKSMARHPHNWLIRTSYMQFYLIPQNDEEGFNEQMNIIKSFNENYEGQYVYGRSNTGDRSWAREERLRFFQVLSLKRYELMNRFQKQFF